MLYAVMLLRILDVRCLLAFWPLHDIELHFLTFFESLEAAHLNCGKVRKQIFAAVVRCDETEAFGIIKPLHCACCHDAFFQ